MNIQERLHTIPDDVRQAFSESFIFLVNEEKFQHFPARNWSKEQILESLAQRLGTDYELQEWENYVIAVNQEETTIAILPRFQHIKDLKA